MECLNEHIARQANKEDHCTGHFWESRFKSQALLSCMCYVDLNPIRAGIAKTPETSEHTSIYERISTNFILTKAVKQQINQCQLIQFNIPLKPLLSFSGDEKLKKSENIPFKFTHYLELVDWTGKSILEDKSGYINNNLPPILDRLSISKKNWFINSQTFEKIYINKFGPRKKRIAA